jgi:hypothetical protein
MKAVTLTCIAVMLFIAAALAAVPTAASTSPSLLELVEESAVETGMESGAASHAAPISPKEENLMEQSESESDALAAAALVEEGSEEQVAQGTEEVTSNTVNFIEAESEFDTEMESDSEADAEAEVVAATDVDAEAESLASTDLEAEADAVLAESVPQTIHVDLASAEDLAYEPLSALTDPDIEPEVRSFIEHNSLTEDNEMRALEDGRLEFDDQGNDVLLEEPVAPGVGNLKLDEDLDAAINRRIAQKLGTAASDVEALAAFLEVSERFSPDAVKEHKSGQIGKMRANRQRARRVQNRRLQGPSASPQTAANPENYGPYDERRKPSEARTFSPELEQALDAERKQRLGTVRPVGTSRAPFCATFPWCKQTPPPPDMAPLPRPEDPNVLKAEWAQLNPMENLPKKLPELKRDPHRFGLVFQHIYDRNKHNEKLANKMAPTN